jgi:hypothetical protein
MIFLVVYDTKLAELRAIKEYDESTRAEAMESLRVTQEELIGDLDHVEVALFEAPSLATLKQTHSRYFKTLTELTTGGERLGSPLRTAQ